MTGPYKKMYLHLFNAITDALGALEEGRALDARRCLMDAQCEAEKIYISHEDPKLPGRIVEIFVENV